MGAGISRTPAMRRSIRLGAAIMLTAPALFGAAFLGDGPALAAPLNDCANSDNGDPTLVSLRRTPSRVDVTSRSKRVQFRVRAADTGGPGPASGVRRVWVAFGRQSGDVGGTPFVPLRLNDAGTWVASVVVARGSRPGNWPVAAIYLEDRAGNSRDLGRADLAAAGFPTSVSVASIADKTPPTLKAFTFTPDVLDTRRSAGTVTFTARANDPQSRVQSIWVGGRGKPIGDDAGGVSMHRVPGTAHKFRGTLRVPRWLGNGTWRVTSIFVDSQTGLSRYYSGARLDRLGFKRDLQITSRIDEVRPRVVEFDLSPAEVDVRSADQEVGFTVRAKDARSGVRFVAVSLAGGDNWERLRKVSGTHHDGVWTGAITVRHCGTGTGTKKPTVYVFDRAGQYGHSRRYGPAALEAHGWPHRVDVLGGDYKAPRGGLVRYVVKPSGPVKLRFTEDVNGITATSAILRKLIGSLESPRHGPVIPGTWVCKDEAGATANCETGNVRAARFTPSTALKPTRNYSLMLNPEHSLEVTDLAGNPFRHDEGDEWWLRTSP